MDPRGRSGASATHATPWPAFRAPAPEAGEPVGSSWAAATGSVVTPVPARPAVSFAVSFAV
ncbi:hypothetical protein [Intrasporangium sp. DVR]|uniref:hypothetical protein n=1 Tax=Intrasporangium sp. DVR TaxID=3127867 RepID=UPI0033416CD0